MTIFPVVTGTVEDSHRYWRLVAPGESKWAVVEIRWLDVDGVQVKGSSSVASGEAAEWSSAENAFDGDLKSYWLADKTESSNRWVGQQFEAPVRVSAEVMQYAHDNYRTYTAELHYSDDGEAWTYVDVADLQGEGVDEPHWEVVPSVEKSDSMLDLF